MITEFVSLEIRLHRTSFSWPNPWRDATTVPSAKGPVLLLLCFRPVEFVFSLFLFSFLGIRAAMALRRPNPRFYKAPHCSTSIKVLGTVAKFSEALQQSKPRVQTLRNRSLFHPYQGSLEWTLNLSPQTYLKPRLFLAYGPPCSRCLVDLQFGQTLHLF